MHRHHLGANPAHPINFSRQIAYKKAHEDNSIFMGFVILSMATLLN